MCLVGCLLSASFPVTEKRDRPVYQHELAGWISLHGPPASMSGEVTGPHAIRQEPGNGEDLAAPSPPPANEVMREKTTYEKNRERKQTQGNRGRSSPEDVSPQSMKKSAASPDARVGSMSPGMAGAAYGTPSSKTETTGNPRNDGAVFAPGELDSPPGVRKRVRPEYPVTARKQKIEGRVVIRLIVDAQGLPVDCAVYRGEPSGYFEQAALEAAYKMRFLPGKKQGRPVRTMVLLPFDFRLK